VASQSNRGVYTVPACLPQVIGVRCEPEFSGDTYRYAPYDYDGIEIAASGVHPVGEGTLPCNSYASPLITAKVWAMLQSNPGMDSHAVERALFCGARRNEEVKECPVILVDDKRSQPSRGFAEEVYARFAGDGYNPALLTNQEPGRPLQTAERYRPERDAETQLLFMRAKYEADVVLASFSGDAPACRWDVRCVLTDGGISLLREDQPGEERFSWKDAGALYAKIIDILS